MSCAHNLYIRKIVEKRKKNGARGGQAARRQTSFASKHHGTFRSAALPRTGADSILGSYVRVLVSCVPRLDLYLEMTNKLTACSVGWWLMAGAGLF
jgi:hypothetical protein